MKKIVLLFVILLITGCERYTYKLPPHSSKYLNNIRLMNLAKRDVIAYEAEIRGMTLSEYLDSLDAEVKDWPFPNAHGAYVPMRSSDKSTPDTIVDGIPYRMI